MLTDMDGYHRRSEHKFYDDIYYPLTIDDFQPYDILVLSTYSLIGAGIRFFEMVNGKASWFSHCGQVIEINGELVVSEANFSRHAFTPVTKYLEDQAKGKYRLTLLRIDNGVWKDVEQQMQAQKMCRDWHLSQEGKKYTVGPFIPMALWSLARNLTPLIRGRYNHIPIPNPSKVFICSSIVDFGWVLGQKMTGIDFFPTSLSRSIASPQDIYDSIWTLFVAGWKRVPKDLIDRDIAYKYNSNIIRESKLEIKRDMLLENIYYQNQKIILDLAA